MKVFKMIEKNSPEVTAGIELRGVEPTKELEAHRLIELSELAFLLGRSAGTIKNDIRRRPSAVPPRLMLPGGRLLRWRLVDITSWLAMHVEGVQK